LKLKFQTVAETTAKNFRGLLYFATPGRKSLGDKTFHMIKLEVMMGGGE